MGSYSSAAMAVLMGNSGFGELDPRGKDYWGELHAERDLRADIADWRFDSITGKMWGWFVLMCNVSSAVMFVLLEYCLEINYVDDPFNVATIKDRNSLNFKTISIITFALTWIYLIDFLVRCFTAQDRFSFFVNWRAKTGVMKLLPTPTLNLMDLLAICIVQSNFWIGYSEDANARYDLAVFATVRILYVIQFVAQVTERKHKTAEITSPVPFIFNRMVDAVLQSLSIVFIGAVVFMHIENWSADRDPKLEFFECIYFIVTTMTTVGYGDISPSSNLAMAFTCGLMMYLILVLFPLITDAAAAFQRITPYNSQPACYNHQPVILWQVSGEISCDKLDKISSELFVSEQSQKVAICVVSNEKPSENMETYLNVSRTQTLVWIEGSLKCDEVADRAGVQYAKAVILMASDDCPADDMLTQDEAICIMGMRVRQFTNDQSIVNGHSAHPQRVILALNISYNAVYFNSGFYGALPEDGPDHQMINKKETTVSLEEKKRWTEATIAISLREMQLQALAKGILCPGFHPFIANLASMRGEVVGDMKKDDAMEQFKNGKNADGTQLYPDKWLSEYFEGAEHEVYSIKVKKELKDAVELKTISVAQISAVVYRKYNCAVLLYNTEARHTADDKLHLKVIASDQGKADDVVKFLNGLDATKIKSDAVWGEVIDRESGGHQPFDGSTDPEETSEEAATLTQASCDKIKLAYDEMSFAENYGDVGAFSRRHIVHDYEERNLHIEEDEDDPVPKAPGMEALVQPPGSEVICGKRGNSTEGCKDHYILITQHMEHVAHFVRTLRTIDVPEADRGDILIVAKEEPSEEVAMLLRMFKDVYMVPIPEEDDGYVSVNTMKQLNITKAKHVVLTANAQPSEEETLKMDHHKMCLRMVVRKLNPKCVCTLEVQHFAQARYFVRGSDKINAWSQDPDMKVIQTAVMSSEWCKRPAAVNRAACGASGIIVEEDLLLPLTVSCCHKSCDINLTRALFGGSRFNFSLLCIPVPEAFWGKKYIELYATMCANGKIPLGLFRTSKEEKQEYIYNNPEKDKILRNDDRVYVTASKTLKKPEPVKAIEVLEVEVGAEAEQQEAEVLAQM